MKKLIKFSILIILMFPLFNIYSQSTYVSVSPILTRAEKKLREIENNEERLIEKIFFDILFKDINTDSRNSFTHFFSNNRPYTLTVLGEPDMLSAMTISISENKEGTWTEVEKRTRWLVDFSIPFIPQRSGTYKIEIKGTFSGTSTYSHFGIIIDQKM